MTAPSHRELVEAAGVSTRPPEALAGTPRRRLAGGGSQSARGQIERLVADSRQRRVGSLNRHELAVRRLEQLLDEGARVRIVVDHQDARHG